MPPEIETHLVNTVLTNGARYYVDHAHPEYSTPECADALELVVRRQGGGADPRPVDARGPPAARAGPGDRRLQEQLRRQGQLVRHARELPRRPRGAVRRARAQPAAVVREPPGVHRRGQGRHRERRRPGRLPDQPARRLLRGGGRARDHAEAPDREHARRAARRPAAVPAPARDRGRRQPVRGRDVPQGRHHRDRARDDRGRASSTRTSSIIGPVTAMRTVSHDPTCRATVELARRRPRAPRSSCSGSSCAWRRSTPTRPASSTAAATTSAAMVLARWEARARRARARPDDARRPARLGHEARRCSRPTCDRDGLAWDDPKLSLLDLQYHDVRPDRSLYERLVRAGKVERLVDEDEVQRGDDRAAGDRPGHTSGASAWRAGPTRSSPPTGTA